MSVWDDVVGQEPAVRVLTRAATAARRGTTGMTHAWLLTGPPGSGRSTAARAFAAALACEDPAAIGCGRCSGCRTALAGSHADVTLFTTEHTWIRRVDVEPLIATAQRRPSVGRWRVIVVEDADRLNETSGNVLLKTIEEPPPQTVWLLCAPAVDDVLPTIRSRARHVPLRIPPAEAVAELLVRRDGVDPVMAAFAARAAQSHVGLARRLARDEGARIRRREVLRLPQRVRGVGDAVIAAGELVDIAAEEAGASTVERDAARRPSCCGRSGPTARRRSRRPCGRRCASSRRTRSAAPAATRPTSWTAPSSTCSRCCATSSSSSSARPWSS